MLSLAKLILMWLQNSNYIIIWISPIYGFKMRFWSRHEKIALMQKSDSISQLKGFSQLKNISDTTVRCDSTTFWRQDSFPIRPFVVNRPHFDSKLQSCRKWDPWFLRDLNSIQPNNLEDLTCIYSTSLIGPVLKSNCKICCPAEVPINRADSCQPGL